MKRIPFLFVFLLCLVLLAGCVSPFPSVVSSDISPFAWGSNLDRDYAYALAPDGNSLVLRGLIQVDLLTGEESHPFTDYAYEDSLLNPLPTSWSTDGRYIALVEASSSSFTAPAYFVDTKTKSVSRVGSDIRNFLFFSPFQDYAFIAGAPTGFFVFKIGDLTPTPLEETINYAELSGFGGTHTEAYSYLWSRELGKPVAQLELLPRPSEENANPTTRKLYLVPYTSPTTVGKADIKNTLDTDYSITGEKWLSYFFDPTGEYVLVVEWKCIGEKPWQCESLDSGYFTDTIFTLIRWKTKEQKEIFRLSSIDSQHVLASSLIAWSADGSTLVVGRKDASAVLLRIKYP